MVKIQTSCPCSELRGVSLLYSPCFGVKAVGVSEGKPRGFLPEGKRQSAGLPVPKADWCGWRGGRRREERRELPGAAGPAGCAPGQGIRRAAREGARSCGGNPPSAGLFFSSL